MSTNQANPCEVHGPGKGTDYSKIAGEEWLGFTEFH